LLRTHFSLLSLSKLTPNIGTITLIGLKKRRSLRIKSIQKNTLLVYFHELSESYSPSSHGQSSLASIVISKSTKTSISITLVHFLYFSNEKDSNTSQRKLQVSPEFK
jgi:hypothetical protein